MTTGADHLQEIVTVAERVASAFPEGAARLEVTATIISNSVIVLAAQLLADGDFESAHDLVTMSGAMIVEIQGHMLGQPGALESLAWAQARVMGSDQPLPGTEPLAPPPTDDASALEWALAALDDARVPEHIGGIFSIDAHCCFGGGLKHCGKLIDGVSVLVNVRNDQMAVASYCADHLQVIQRAGEIIKAERGKLTDQEIEELLADDPGAAVPSEPIEGDDAMAWALASIEASSVSPDRCAVVDVGHLCAFGGGIERCGKPIDQVTMYVAMDDGSIAGASYCAPHMAVMREAIDVWRLRRQAEELEQALKAESDAKASEG